MNFFKTLAAMRRALASVPVLITRDGTAYRDSKKVGDAMRRELRAARSAVSQPQPETDATREAFEVWLEAEDASPAAVLMGIQKLWRCWQAARAALQAPQAPAIEREDFLAALKGAPREHLLAVRAEIDEALAARSIQA